MKRKVNFIITCFNREAYWPHLKQLLHSYETIEPIIALAYNGDDPEFECDVRIPNKGLQMGEFELIKAGYQSLIERDTESDLFIKLGMDSWLCDEEVINRIFMNMEHYRAPYAGTFWNTQMQLSTDIFFVNIAYGNVFEELKFDGAIMENSMYNAVARLGGRFYRINEREPVHPHNRNSCAALGWTMEHDLQANIDFLENFTKKKPMMGIERNYSVMCQRRSDINQLLPTLHKYASQSETIIEMGVREVVSTWALLAGGPKWMRSYDINSSPNIEQAIRLAGEAGIDFEFHKQDVIADDFEIEEVDFLFIDTWHRYDQLKKELSKHGNKAKKFLAFHDTESFGYVDEEETDFKKQPQGLVLAIEEFLAENPHWEEFERLIINNGLIVLRRKDHE